MLRVVKLIESIIKGTMWVEESVHAMFHEHDRYHSSTHVDDDLEAGLVRRLAF